MTINYKDEAITGTKRTRCYQINIGNGIDKSLTVTPTIEFLEEEISEVNGALLSKEIKGILQLAFDPAKVINLIDPETGIATGETTTLGDLYVVMFSAYMQTALERDNA